jgi:hypothetical protein
MVPLNLLAGLPLHNAAPWHGGRRCWAAALSYAGAVMSSDYARVANICRKLDSNQFAKALTQSC